MNLGHDIPLRLEKFRPSTSRSALIAVSSMLAQLLWGVSLGVGVASSQRISEELNFSTGSYLLWIPPALGIFGCIVYGHYLCDTWDYKPTLIVGSGWWILGCIATSFSTSYISLSTALLLTISGGSLMVPATLNLLRISIPEGVAQNICMTLWGAMGPVGARSGSIVLATSGAPKPLNSLLLCLALVGSFVFVPLLKALPSDDKSLGNSLESMREKRLRCLFYDWRAEKMLTGSDTDM